KLLTPTQTPEPITHVGQSRCSSSRETAAHDRLKSPLTIAEIRNGDRQPPRQNVFRHGIRTPFSG
ncbi:hypothetical protein QCM77_45805, partial [Bradyrhizobium sp. SSUT18]|uniref:hypothetical protein n=1 Tax=Bradyrhizobium sp. SSUT18 TaxID=3040602 RepID=UPI002446D3DB